MSTTRAADTQKLHSLLMTAGYGLLVARRRRGEARKAHLSSAATALRQAREMGFFPTRADVYLAETAAKAEVYSTRA